MVQPIGSRARHSTSQQSSITACGSMNMCLVSPGLGDLEGRDCVLVT